MRQENAQSNSPLPKGCGCSVLVLVGLISAIVLLVQPLFLTLAIKDKQVEIYLPSFLSIFINKAYKAMQSEAKQYVSSLNKSQQAYYAENSDFSNYIPALGLGIKTETKNYKYSTRVTQAAAFNYAVAKKPELKNYVGGVFLVPAYPNAAKNEMMTTSILCETTEKRPLFTVKKADEPDKPAEPNYQNGEVVCGTGTTELTR